MTEKRKHKRFTVMCKIECINTEVYIQDINNIGMQIKSKYKITSRIEIPFYIVLPNMDIINIIGDIIWDKKITETEYHYGVKFKTLSGEHESIFGSFLAELNRDPITI